MVYKATKIHIVYYYTHGYNLYPSAIYCKSSINLKRASKEFNMLIRKIYECRPT